MAKLICSHCKAELEECQVLIWEGNLTVICGNCGTRKKLQFKQDLKNVEEIAVSP